MPGIEDGKPVAPSSFYKYRSMSGDAAARTEEIVLGNEIYFARPSSFNDPFDLRPSFSLAATPERQREDFIRMSRKFEPHLSEEERQAAAQLVMETSLSTENIQATTDGIQAMHNMAMNEIGVCCVSASRADVLMWSHYADAHRGVCLEFDGNGKLMAHAQQISYSEVRVPINSYEDSQDQMTTKSLLTKSAQWKYEDEWRLIRYAKGPGKVKFRPENLTGIIVGAQADRSVLEAVRAWNKQRTAPVQLFRARVSRTHFAVEIDPLKG
jgi:hypothetical protein